MYEIFCTFLNCSKYILYDAKYCFGSLYLSADFIIYKKTKKQIKIFITNRTN